MAPPIIIHPWPTEIVDSEDAAANKWFIATAAINHMTRSQSMICNLNPVAAGLVISEGNGAGMQVRGTGAVNTETVVLPEVWYVPGLSANLVSVGQLTELGLSVSICRDVCTIARGSDGCVVGKAHRSGSLYEVEFLRVPLN